MEEIILEENEAAEQTDITESAENSPIEEVKGTPGGANAATGDVLDTHLKEMALRFPNVDIMRLEKNPAFRRFVGSRYGRESLADLYEAYTDIVSGVEKAASYKSAAKASRSTGGGSGKSAGALSSAQREALKRWNESNPDMKMSEKEFLQRD